MASFRREPSGPDSGQSTDTSREGKRRANSFPLVRSQRLTARRLSTTALLAVTATAAGSSPAAARVSVRVDTKPADQNVHVNGVWIGRHGAAWFGQGPKLARRVGDLRCLGDDSPRARLVGRGDVFSMAGLALDASCARDAAQFSTIRSRRGVVRLGFGAIRLGRRTPASVRRRLVYLSETSSSVTYGVARRGDYCGSGETVAGWQVKLKVSKSSHDAIAVRVFSGVIEPICP